MNVNYWDKPYRIFYHEITLAGTDQEFKLNNILDDISDRALIGLRIRPPHADAKTFKGKPLIGSAVYHASHIVLAESEEKKKIQMPISSVAERTGGDNNFLRINDQMRLDFTSGRSFLWVSDAVVLAAGVAAGQAFELELMFEDAAC